MTITLRRTNATDNDFKALVELLDNELRILDGDEHVFYAQLNKTADIDSVVAYIDGQAAGCGAIRPYSNEVMEIKRMYVLPSFRRSGIATTVLGELEKWTKELRYNSCVLETGKRQPEAIALYNRQGYAPIPNYGKYADVPNSVCFKKTL